MSAQERDWFAGDEGMRMPKTRAETWKENRAQHDVADMDGYRYCRSCGRINASLNRYPCAVPIRTAK